MHMIAAVVTLMQLVAASAVFGQDIVTRGYNCKLDDTECLKNYLQDEVIANFSKGFPQYGVKSFDPLDFGDLSFGYKVGPGVEIELHHTNSILYGLSKIEVIDVTTTFSGSNFNIEVQVSIPKMLYVGSYTLVGSWPLVPIQWKGDFNMTMGGVTDTWQLSANLMKNGAETYLDLASFSLKPKLTTFSTYASGLFGTWDEVGDFVLKKVNECWEGFYPVMWKLAEPDVVKTVSRALERILMKTPIPQ